MPDLALLAIYVLCCIAVAVGIGLVFMPAGLIAGGVLGGCSVVRVARSPEPSQLERDPDGTRPASPAE